jgi:hypothetical protein
VKPSPHAAAPLASLPVPSGCWESMSLDFVFGLPKDSEGNTGIVVFVDRLSKMAHLAAVPDTVDGEDTAKLFIDRVFRQHGLPVSIVSDRDPRFTGKFWDAVFKVLGTKLDMSTADHPQTDGQTKRVNLVVEDILRSICAETPKRWSAMLPLVEFALNNAVHASTGCPPFYVNGLTHPRVPLTLPLRGSGLGGGEIANRLADVSPLTVRKQVDEFLSTRLSVLRHVRDDMADSQDKPKEQADARSRCIVASFEVGDLVLLNAKNLPTHAVSAVFKTKLALRRTFQGRGQEGPSVHAQPSQEDAHTPRVLRWLAQAVSRPKSCGLRRAGTSSATTPSLGSEARKPSLEENSTPSERGWSQGRPPAALLDEQGDLHYHVERLLARRRCQGQYQYLVKWRGYPHSENSWEFEVPLRQDCPDVVDAFDRHDHQPRQGLRPRERSNRASQKMGELMGQ